MSGKEGVSILIGDKDSVTINNVKAFVAQIAGSLESDSENLGLLLSLQSVHNAISSLSTSGNPG